MFFLWELRAKKILSALEPYLSKDYAILNIGAGDCILDKALMDNGYSIVSIDAANRSKTEISPIICNGASLPFKDDSFDIVMAHFVLFLNLRKHESIISEMRRVSRKYLIIIEDTPDSAAELMIKKIWGLLLYRNCQLLFQSDKHWQRLFNSLILQTLKTEKISVNLINYPLFNQMLFYLKK